MAGAPKYGIKLSAEYVPGRKKIEAITRFQSGNILEGFTQITEANYLSWVAVITPFHYWDVSKSTVEKDTAAETSHNQSADKSAIRKTLKELFYEIQFTSELEEDTTALQAQYDDLLAEYNPEEA